MSTPLERCIGGVVPPMATPLADDGNLDERSLLRLRDRLVGGGVAGIFALGSTGEASYLSNARRRQVVDTLSRDPRPDVPLLVGVVEPTTNRVIEAAEALLTPAVDVVVATGPFYAAASPREITAHFEAVARAVARPVLAYNIPSNVGYDLPAEVLVDLVARGVVTGVKDSSANLAGFRQLVMAGEPESGVAYFSGSDGLLDAALQIGANGSVAGLANVAPELFVEAVSAHLSGEVAALAEAQRRIVVLTRLYTTSDSGAGLNSTQLGSIKTALKLQGVIATDQLSVPMQRSSTEKTAAVREVLAAAGVLDAG